MSSAVIFLAIAAALAMAIILIYNSLVKLRQFVDSGWSDIDVQLKRRADLIPRLVETVKGYAAHERGLFTEVIDRRNAALSAGNDPVKRGFAEQNVQRSTSRLLALAEDYPDLKASENYLNLQEELSETEDKIEMARRYYNGTVRNMNTKVQSFPINVIAGLFGFGSRHYFDMDSAERAAPDMNL